LHCSWRALYLRFSSGSRRDGKEKSMSAESDFQVAAPPRGWERLKVVGSGFILAATGVGAGDLVTSLVAGTRFGTALI
jgi:hypothetical protein